MMMVSLAQPLVELALLVPPKLLQPDSLLDDHKLGVGMLIVTNEKPGEVRAHQG
jgi:hypothetical protein